MNILLSGLLAKSSWAAATPLNPSNFEETVANTSQTIILFYKEGNKQNATAQVLWDGIAHDGKAYAHPTLIANVNCDEFAELCEEHNINRFPSLLTMEADIPIHVYEGPLEPTHLIRYINDMAFNEVSTFASRAEMLENRHLADIKDRVVIAYQGSMRKGNAEMAIFEGVASLMRMEGKFVEYPHNEGVVDRPNIEVFRTDGTSTKVAFDQQIQISDLMNFVKGEAVPYFMEIEKINKWQLDSSPLDAVYVIGEDFEESKAIWEKIAMGNRGRLSMGFMQRSLAKEYFGDQATPGSIALVHRYDPDIFEVLELPEEQAWAGFLKGLHNYSWSNVDRDTIKVTDPWRLRSSIHKLAPPIVTDDEL